MSKQDIQRPIHTTFPKYHILFAETTPMHNYLRQTIIYFHYAVQRVCKLLNHQGI